jgi:hypothetical protein
MVAPVVAAGLLIQRLVFLHSAATVELAAAVVELEQVRLIHLLETVDGAVAAVVLAEMAQTVNTLATEVLAVAVAAQVLVAAHQLLESAGRALLYCYGLRGIKNEIRMD